MSKVEIEISVNTDKVTDFIQEMINIGNRYGIEPLVINNRYIYFDLDNLTEVKCNM